MDLVHILSIVCIGLFLLLGLFLLVSKSRSSISSKLIGIFFILWGLNFLDGLLMLSGYYLDHPGLAFWEDPLVFLYGPVIYFYASSITTEKFKLRAKDLLHLIPFLVFFLMILITIQVKPTDYKIAIMNTVLDLNQPAELLLPVIVIFTHIFIYIFLSKRRLKKYQHGLMGFYSSFNISWLGNTLNFLIAILILSLINSSFQFAGNQVLFQAGLGLLIFIVLLFIGQVYFKAFEQPRLFATVGNPNTSTTSLSYDEKARIFQKIKLLLEEEHIFLNPELTVDDLAKSLDVSPRKVSQVINEMFGQNFFDLINTYRIEFSRDIIKNNTDKGLTILEIMYQSGFNSKSSFNTQFRKKAGLTPSEFKKLHS